MSKSCARECDNSFDKDGSEDDDYPVGLFQKPSSNTNKTSSIQNPKPTSNAAEDETSKAKCLRPVLSIQVETIIKGFKRKACSRLICLDCDVQINQFCNFTWKTTCDYLFFRSNFGNMPKLKQGLIEELGTLALHCGCRGIVIIKPRFVEEIDGLRWVCLSHS